jgi:hypothetical protein
MDPTHITRQHATSAYAQVMTPDMLTAVAGDADDASVVPSAHPQTSL